MVCEIGSEFSFKSFDQNQGIVLPDKVMDYTFTFSGRTSLETVLKNEPQIRKAMLPSYCCDSIIEPFRKKGIQVCYYDVNFEDGLQIKLDVQDDIDVILWCNYFGYRVQMPDLKEFINDGGIVIEDITHSFFSKEKFHAQSQYLVASIRKWEPVLCGGYCASVRGKLKYKPIKVPPKSFLEKKKHAMVLKSAFLNGDNNISKDTFLQEFADSNKWLSTNYSELSVDDESRKILDSIDWGEEYRIRRDNAKVLYAGLKNKDYIQLIFEEKEMDCPLFVPIVIKNGKREIIRKRLIDNRIYCPIHWPKPHTECKSNLYDLELSLICDQRYGEADMNRIISVICNC